MIGYLSKNDQFAHDPWKLLCLHTRSWEIVIIEKKNGFGCVRFAVDTPWVYLKLEYLRTNLWSFLGADQVTRENYGTVKFQLSKTKLKSHVGCGTTGLIWNVSVAAY